MAEGFVGDLGEAAWANSATGLVTHVHSWDSLEALQQLVGHPPHVQAKSAQGHWLSSHQVVVLQVLRTDGDTRLAHLLAIAGSPPGG